MENVWQLNLKIEHFERVSNSLAKAKVPELFTSVKPKIFVPTNNNVDKLILLEGVWQA